MNANVKYIWKVKKEQGYGEGSKFKYLGFNQALPLLTLMHIKDNDYYASNINIRDCFKEIIY